MCEKRKKVSIVVPVYNVINYLEACLESVLNQTYSDYELILVNDGSTDGSREICEKYKERYKDIIVYLSQENKGLAEARNAGIRAANGEYICFLDSDDRYEPDYLQKMLAAAEKNDADMVICDYYETDTDGIRKEMKPETCLYEEGVQDRNRLYWVLTFTGDNHYATVAVVAWNKLIRTSVMKEFAYPIGKMHEDEFIIFDLLGACEKIVWIPDALYAYAIRESGIMREKDSEHLLKRLEVLEAYYTRIEKSMTVCNEWTVRFIRAFLENALIYNKMIGEAVGSRKRVVKKTVLAWVRKCFKEYGRYLPFKARVKFMLKTFLEIVL